MKTIKTIKIPSAAVPATEPELVVPPKSDPNYYRIIGRISAKRRAMTKDQMSDMAKLSHGPKSKRDGYHGGRKKKKA